MTQITKLADQRQSRVAADVGGTFADVISFNDGTGESFFGKTLTTPASLVNGIFNGVKPESLELGAAIQLASHLPILYDDSCFMSSLSYNRDLPTRHCKGI